MRFRIFFLFVVMVLSIASSAQRTQLTFGLNTLAMPADVGGIGASIDLRLRTGTHTELIGLFSATRFFELDHRGGPHIQFSDGAEWDDPYILSGGLGFGVRLGKEGHGFHVGTIAGAMRYQGVDMDYRTKHIVSPAIALTMGHHIGSHIDVSVDAMVMRDVKAYYQFYPLFRVSYVLLRR